VRRIALAALLLPAVSAHAARPFAPNSSGQASPNARPAPAHLPAYVNGEVIAALQGIAAQNQCLLYTYDHNGNITARVDQGFGTAAWGSSVFGCFKWTAP